MIPILRVHLFQSVSYSYSNPILSLSRGRLHLGSFLGLHGTRLPPLCPSPTGTMQVPHQFRSRRYLSPELLSVASVDHFGWGGFRQQCLGVFAFD